MAALMGPPAGPAPRQRESFAAVEAAVKRGIQLGIYPGAVVVIGRRDTVLYARGFGHLTWSSRAPVPHPDSTVWDIASLTKVVGTTGAVMRLVDEGRVNLDAAVAKYLPRFAGRGRDSVTVRMLLNHTSGLRSFLPLYRLAATRQAAIDLLYAEPLSRPPGATAVYSDLNAMLLGLLVEAVRGEPLDRVVHDDVLVPLGLRSTTYRPPTAWLRRIAPTGLDRGGVMRRGMVNDFNAARLGGVAGHAGLFSTGRDLARYAQAWLRRGAGPKGPWVSAATVDRFLARDGRSGSRLLGWDTRDSVLAEGPSVFGSLVSDAAYGHTGWTGTELWIDPTHDVFLVFLTNRSFDPRARRSIEALRDVRAELSDAVVRTVPRSCAATLVARC
jgi:CubicO group peptidase (beta-lactamase class C family)